jgi:hypothetical protein
MFTPIIAPEGSDTTLPVVSNTGAIFAAGSVMSLTIFSEWAAVISTPEGSDTTAPVASKTGAIPTSAPMAETDRHSESSAWYMVPVGSATSAPVASNTGAIFTFAPVIGINVHTEGEGAANASEVTKNANIHTLNRAVNTDSRFILSFSFIDKFELNDILYSMDLLYNI